LEVTSVVAREIGAPPGVTPIEWRLLSNRSADPLEEAAELIDWDRVHWEIELLFWCSRELAASRRCNWAPGNRLSGPWRCIW